MRNVLVDGDDLHYNIQLRPWDDAATPSIQGLRRRERASSRNTIAIFRSQLTWATVIDTPDAMILACCTPPVASAHHVQLTGALVHTHSELAGQRSRCCYSRPRWNPRILETTPPPGNGAQISGSRREALDTKCRSRYTPINRINLTIMLRDRLSADISEFLRYLAVHPEAEDGLPSLPELSRELGISVAALREQLEVARALGLVEVRPRTGTRRRPFSFAPAVRQSLGYALALSDGHFEEFSDLRNHLEAAYWDEAARKLTPDDKAELQSLIVKARAKLRGSPLQVPHEEHRALHLLIYRRLPNPFVIGILEGYWDMYEAVGLNMYSGDMHYLNEVWDFHARMVEGICRGDFAAGRQALIEHVELLAQRPTRVPRTGQDLVSHAGQVTSARRRKS